MFLCSCSDNNTSDGISAARDTVITGNKPVSKNITEDSIETKAIQQWLVTSLKNYLITNKGVEKICSPQYYQFKEEGFKTMDDEINYDDYEKKWSKIYGKESFCSDCPYFIAAQDLSSKITVEAVFKENKEDDYWFNVTINDPKMKAKYNDVIKVIKSGSSYLIDDVIMKDL